MALEKKELVSLMKAAAQATPSKDYNYKGENMSADALNAALREELQTICGDYNAYRRNQPEVFELVEETMDSILPKMVTDAYSQFAEVRTFKQGDKPVFKVNNLGSQRAKQFITRVGLAGLYETFKLGSTTFELQTSAIGGAAAISFEEFLDGRVDFAELVKIVSDGMNELIYKEIAKAMIGATNQLPPANFATTNKFDTQLMDRLITIAGAYGNPTIYCTREFAVKMIPETGFVSDPMRDTLWNVGYLGSFHGVPVTVLPQAFEDETNARKILDPGYAWVIPNGAGNTKPVKVAFEGTVHMKDMERHDWSHAIHMYQKVGVGVIMTNNICVYEDTTLKGKLNTVGA